MGRGQFRVEAVLPAPAKSMFIERDSAAFRSLLSKSLKIGQLEVQDVWQGGGGSTFVRIVTKPEFGAWVPKGVAGSVNSKQLEFHDIIEYNPAYISQPPFRIFVRTESPLLGDKLDIQLTLTIEEVDAQTCRQVLEGHIRVGIFGVGRVVESIVKDSLQNTYKKLPDIVRRWQAFRAEAIATGNERALLAGRPPVGSSVSWIRKEVCEKLEHSRQQQQQGQAQQQQQQHRQQVADQVAEPALPKPVDPSTSPERSAPSSSAAAAAAALHPSPSARTLGSAAQASVYYDAVEEDEQGEEEKAEVEAAEAGQQRSKQQQPEVEVPSPVPVLPQVPPGLLLGEPIPSPEPLLQQQQQAGTPTPPPHHRRSSSVDSVGLGPGAGVSDHKASSHLWARFNRYWAEWDSYWQAQGVHEEAQAAAAAEEAAQSSLLGGLFSAIGREMYYTSALLVIVVYLGLTRRGVVTVRPDAERQRRQHRHGASEDGFSNSGTMGGTASTAGGTVSFGGLGHARTVSLDRAEAEVAARLVRSSGTSRAGRGGRGSSRLSRFAFGSSDATSGSAVSSSLGASAVIQTVPAGAAMNDVQTSSSSPPKAARSRLNIDTISGQQQQSNSPLRCKWLACFACRGEALVQ